MMLSLAWKLMNTWYTGQWFSSLQTTVREHRKQKRVPKSAAAEENHGDRKEPDTQGRVRSVLRNGKAAALYSLRHQGIIHLK